MTTRNKAEPDKDQIIADLQAKLKSRDMDISNLRNDLKAANDRADENWSNGHKWRDTVSDARKERDAAKMQAEEDRRALLAAEKRLSFADGYILAMKGADYPPSQIVIDGPIDAERFGALKREWEARRV